MTRTTLGEDYLSEYGDLAGYHERLTLGERTGQAFFNSLNSVDQNLLVGTLVDPFHYNGWEGEKRIVNAIDRLLWCREKMGRLDKRRNGQ